MTSATATPVSNDPKSLHARMLDWLYFLCSDRDIIHRSYCERLIAKEVLDSSGSAKNFETFKKALGADRPDNIKKIFGAVTADLFLSIVNSASIRNDSRNKFFTEHEKVLTKLVELGLTQSIKDAGIAKAKDDQEPILSKLFYDIFPLSPSNQFDLSLKVLRLLQMAGLPLELAAYKPDKQKEIISNLLCCAPEIPALFCLMVDNTKPTGHPNLWWQGILDRYIEATKMSDDTSFQPDKANAVRCSAVTHAMTVLQKLIDDCGLPPPDLSSPIGASLSNQYLAVFGFNIREYYARKQPSRTDAVPYNTMMIDVTTPVLGTVSITSINGINLHQVFGGNQGRQL